MCQSVKGARAGLLTSSILLLVIALTFIAGGVVLCIGKSAYGESLGFLKDELTASETAFGQTVDVSDLDVRFVTLPLGAVLIFFGVLITAVSILGIIAGAGQFYRFVIVFLVFISCLYFMQIVVIICAYIDRTPFDSTVKRLLKLSLEEYTGLTGQDSLTLGWNAIMSYKQCCGVDSFRDFDISTQWTKMVGATTVVTPAICCITEQNPPNCATNANYQTQTFYNRGCYNHIFDHVTSSTGVIIAAVFLIVLLEFLCIFFAAWIICYRKSQGLTKVGNYERYN